MASVQWCMMQPILRWLSGELWSRWRTMVQRLPQMDLLSGEFFPMLHITSLSQTLTPSPWVYSLANDVFVYLTSNSEIIEMDKSAKLHSACTKIYKMLIKHRHILMSCNLSFVGKDGPPCKVGLITFGWIDATCDSWVKTELEPRTTEWEHESVILPTEFKVHPAVNVTDVCTHVARVRGYPSDGVGYGWVSHLSRTMASISWAWVQMVNSLLQFIIPALCPSGTFLPWGWSDHGNSVYRLFCFLSVFLKLITYANS